MTEETKDGEKPPEQNKRPGVHRLILPGVIALGALLGLVFALSMPAGWLFVPEDAGQTARDDGAETDKNPKEFYA